MTAVERHTGDGLPRRLTRGGLARSLTFVMGAWPHATITAEQRETWWLRLSRFDDDTVMSAVFALSGDTDPRTGRGVPPPSVGDVFVRARAIANRAELDRRAAERAAVPEVARSSSWADQVHAELRPLVHRTRIRRMLADATARTRARV